MLILLETPANLQLLKPEKESYKQVAIHTFGTQIEAATFYSEQTTKLPQLLQTFLTKNKIDSPLLVCDEKLMKMIENELKIKCIFDGQKMREVRVEYKKQIFDNEDGLKDRIRAYAHFVANSKIADCPIKNDIMVMESLKMIEQVDTDINKDVMELKEWFGFHFPELEEVIPNGFEYANAVAKIGNRKNVEALKKKENESIEESKLTKISTKDLETISKKAKMSFGTEINDEEATKIVERAKGIIKMYEYRNELDEYLKKIVSEIAPNTAALLGESVTAKMIAKAGSLVELSKMAASTIQIIGAEKAFYNSVSEKTDTPKYGFIYHSPLIAKVNSELKGRAARSLAAKASLAIKIDTFSKGHGNNIGLAARLKLENKFLQLETKKKKNERNHKTKIC